MKDYRKNEGIKAPLIRVIVAETGEVLGDMSVLQGLEYAKKYGLDLVEIAHNANPPICKIMNYGQFVYQQRKSEQKIKKNQKQATVKTLRLGFRIGEHDADTKSSQARKFLASGDIVRVVMQFRGREISHMDFGLDKMTKFVESLKDIATVEQAPKKVGMQVSVVLVPKK